MVRGARASEQARPLPWRSEEHTSELQSPEAISYAVFCLKKKKDNRDADGGIVDDLVLE